MSDKNRDKIVGLLMEQFLNHGLGSIRSMCEQAYIYGQQEAYQRGRDDANEEKGCEGIKKGLRCSLCVELNRECQKFCPGPNGSHECDQHGNCIDCGLKRKP